MTPNERLLKAAKAIKIGWDDSSIDGSAFTVMINNLIAAVKECEAAAMGPPIDADKLRAAFDELSSGRTASSPTITDQQRRLGLRSLRHMGKDYANWDYD